MIKPAVAPTEAPVTITFQSRDLNSDPVPTEDDVYRVVISNPDGSTTEVVAEHVNAGLYEAIFTPMFGGDYDVSVTMENATTEADSHVSINVGTDFTIKVI